MWNFVATTNATKTTTHKTKIIKSKFSSGVDIKNILLIEASPAKVKKVGLCVALMA